MSSDTLDLNTAVPERGRRRRGPVTEVALTIVAHDDRERVGGRVFLGGGEASLSRTEPVFEDGEPLRDRFVSRSPIHLHPAGAAGLTIDARESRTVLRVDGTRVESSTTLPWSAVDDGVVLSLGDRVALVLNRRAAADATPDLGLLGVSAAAERIRRGILQVADLDVPVLVLGESGSGKERVAQALHAASPRAAARCVAVNMATVPAALAASELFGHVKGAFSGAGAARDGHFVRADGGTLFLDEIGDTPAEVQPMLLRALETHEIVPVGSSTPRRLDVRIVAATDADLDGDVASGQFRAPLLHRLAGFRIEIPPLRARREDVGVLAGAFAAEERRRVGDPMDWALPAELVATLVRRTWPGNVRELRNTVRQLVIHNRGQAEMDWADLLPPEPAAAGVVGVGVVGAAPAPAARAGDLDAAAVRAALEAEGWQIKRAAERLGVSRAALYRRMDKLGIERSDDQAR